MPSTINQAYVFLATVYAGFIIGFIYDLFRMMRHITRPGKLATAILDLLFWLIMACLSFLVVFHVNYGEVRLYTIAGLIIGWGLYALILSPIIFKVLVVIYNAICTVCKWIVRVIAWPFKMVFYLLKFPVRLLKRFIKAVFGRSRSFATKILKKT